MAGTGLNSKLYISSDAPASYDAAGMEAIFPTPDPVSGTGVEIENPISSGISTGGTYGSTSDILMDGETVESKTSLTTSEFSISLFEDETNSGRTELDNAYDSRDYFTFLLVNGRGTRKYFQAKVMGRVFEEGDTEAHEKVMYTIKPRAKDPIIG